MGGLKIVRRTEFKLRAHETPDIIKVAVIGLGRIGIETAALIYKREEYELVGLVDISPDLIGRDLSELAELDEMTGIKVVEEIGRVHPAPDAAILTTSSTLPSVFPTLKELILAGINVVTSCEEMIFPWLNSPEMADELDELCRRNGAIVYATGVNPGFVMDRLPAFLAQVCQEIKRVEVTRVVDASTRRRALQAKIGSGLTVEEFEERISRGEGGHAGLSESLAYLARKLDLDVDEIEEEISPVIAQREIKTDFFDVPPGRVIGVRQIATGRDKKGGEPVKLRL
ncbi:TPA: dihydrodipicolinate reductase, partial [Candidatus Poribacteria bacterium]|nr:dihydrodipicolinate reductase [Candidatus Poribacteria bacterium]